MDLTKNIYLSGFMGSGKSVVGQALAKRLGIPFIDTDTEIAKTVRLSIEKIFKKKGEDFFREEERKVLGQLRHGIPRVIATGGGMVLSILNREIFRQGVWINLKATPATILSRIGSQKHRPLLGKKVKREEVEKILNARRPYYDLAPYQMETDGLNPGAIVETILTILPTIPNR